MIDLDLEAKTLYAMCAYPDCLDAGMGTVRAEHYADQSNRRIFETIKAMYADEKPISVVTVYEAVKPLVGKNDNRWAWVRDAFCSSAEFNFLISKLKALYRARRFMSLADRTRRQLEDGFDADESIRAAQEELFAIASDTDQQVKAIDPKDLAARVLDTVSKRMERGSSGGIWTSYYKLNKAINGGFQPGELVIVAGKTGQGKTAFTMNLCRDIAIVQKQPTLYLNTEMNDEQIDTRLAALITKDQASITYEKLATGNLTQDELTQVASALDAIHGSQFYPVTKPDLTIDDVHSLARRFKAQKGIKVLVLDYVGRMETADPKLKEYQVLKVIAKRLKTLAQTLQITVIMLAQLNEDEKLAGAKGMKDEADLMVYMDEMDEDEQAEYVKPYNYLLVIDKNRNGPRGKIPLQFIGEKMLFVGEKAGEVAKIGTVVKEPRRNKRGNMHWTG